MSPLPGEEGNHLLGLSHRSRARPAAWRTRKLWKRQPRQVRLCFPQSHKHEFTASVTTAVGTDALRSYFFKSVVLMHHGAACAHCPGWLELLYIQLPD